MEILKLLIAAGQRLDQVGHIGFSRSRRNSVISNVIGAAAYYGHKKLLLFLLGKVDQGLVDVKAIESADFGQKGPYRSECNQFTPLQLALVGPNPQVHVVKLLFGKGDANHSVYESSTGNNIAHLAAKFCPADDVEVLEYVVKNARVDPFERNKQGDTPLTIVRALGNQRAIEILEDCQADFDDTAKKTDELMAELMGED